MSDTDNKAINSTGMDVIAAEPVKKRSQLSSIWFRYKKNRLAMLGLILLITMLIVSFGSMFFFSYEDTIVQDIVHKHSLPFTLEGHPLGTDHYGRDMLMRLLFGGRLSLSMGFAVVFVSLTVGGVLGATAAFYGGKIDNVIMRIMDVFLAIPQILMAMALVAALGTSLVNLMIALTIANVPRFARIVRSSVLQVRRLDYIEAARAHGSSDFRTIIRHILPNALGPILVQATLQLGSTINSIAGLSFIGLGVQSPMAEWGTMLSEGKVYMRQFPFVIIEPGIFICLAVLSFNLIGDGLRDALDPKLKN